MPSRGCVQNFVTPDSLRIEAGERNLTEIQDRSISYLAVRFDMPPRGDGYEYD